MYSKNNNGIIFDYSIIETKQTLKNKNNSEFVFCNSLIPSINDINKANERIIKENTIFSKVKEYYF